MVLLQKLLKAKITFNPSDHVEIALCLRLAFNLKYTYATKAVFMEGQILIEL